MTLDPFRIDGPAYVSFSGGLSSAYMLRRILDAGPLPEDVYVLFCNTGKEREETLEFVDMIANRWNVAIHWLEYRRSILPTYRSELAKNVAARARETSNRPYRLTGDSEPGYLEVTYATASRRGEPFENLIEIGGLPNFSTRMCTQELKIKTANKWMRQRGHEHWDVILGIRADEADRVRKMSTPTRERWERILPMADAGITLADVHSFWQTQPFTLMLAPEEGNCDLCFLKSVTKKRELLRHRPELAQWWIEQERRTGQRFRVNHPPYEELALAVTTGVPSSVDVSAECFCGD